MFVCADAHEGENESRRGRITHEAGQSMEDFFSWRKEQARVPAPGASNCGPLLARPWATGADALVAGDGLARELLLLEPGDEGLQGTVRTPPAAVVEAVLWVRGCVWVCGCVVRGCAWVCGCVGAWVCVGVCGCVGVWVWQ